MTQYDQIGANYDQANEQFYKLLECKVMEKVLIPELKKPNLKLVEFAAGTGYYTTRAFDWSEGASITSMDISQAMLDVNGRVNKDKIDAGRLRIITADGTQVRSFAPDDSREYFDGAFGGWFFNYATSRENLRAMFENVAINIKPGGFFVGVVPYPEEDLATRGAELKKPPFPQILPWLEFTRELEDKTGWYSMIYITDSLKFEGVHHRLSVYKEVAEEAGFSAIEWSPADLPREEFISPGAPPQNDLTPEDYKKYTDVGFFSIMKMYKK